MNQVDRVTRSAQQNKDPLLKRNRFLKTSPDGVEAGFSLIR